MRANLLVYSGESIVSCIPITVSSKVDLEIIKKKAQSKSCKYTYHISTEIGINEACQFIDDLEK